MILLRVLRALLEISQRDVGAVIGVNHRRVSEIESGERRLTPRQAERLARFLISRLVTPNGHVHDASADSTTNGWPS